MVPLPARTVDRDAPEADVQLTIDDVTGQPASAGAFSTQVTCTFWGSPGTPSSAGAAGTIGVTLEQDRGGRTGHGSESSSASLSESGAKRRDVKSSGAFLEQRSTQLQQTWHACLTF